MSSIKAPRETARDRERRIYLAEGCSFRTGDLVRMGGTIHLALNCEHLICHSTTNEAASDFADASLRWNRTDKTRVTCRGCLSVIEICAPHSRKA